MFAHQNQCNIQLHLFATLLTPTQYNMFSFSLATPPVFLNYFHVFILDDIKTFYTFIYKHLRLPIQNNSEWALMCKSRIITKVDRHKNLLDYDNKNGRKNANKEQVYNQKTFKRQKIDAWLTNDFC